MLIIDDTVRLTTKSQKSAYEEAKIMQHCINVMKQQRPTSDDKKEEKKPTRKEEKCMQ